MAPWLVALIVFLALVVVAVVVGLVVRSLRPSHTTVDRVIMIGGTALAALSGIITAVVLPDADRPSASVSERELPVPGPSPTQWAGGPFSPQPASPSASPDARAGSDPYADVDALLTGVDEVTLAHKSRFDLDSGRLNQLGSDDFQLDFGMLLFGEENHLSSKVEMGWIDNIDLPDCAGRARLESRPKWLSLMPRNWQMRSICVRTTTGRWAVVRVVNGLGGASDFRIRFGFLKD
ncbi:hypothetical protein [Streptomyces sp. NPDC048269]|uniref:hypothetical protein n=1 Tax=Streptomyces sp. NPDC048269 TaxID=3155753 RepID=UPI003424FAFF